MKTLPATFEDALYSVVHESDKPAKAIASEIGVRHGYLLDAANPHRDDNQFQARLIVPVTKASGNDALVRFIAHAAGGVFFRVPRDGRTEAATARSVKEFGEYLSESAEASADRVYTPSEAKAIDAQGMEAVAAILAHLEQVRSLAGLQPRGETQVVNPVLRAIERVRTA